MSDGPEWFAPKQFGIGAGMPISWQGWAVTLGSIAIILGSTLLFKRQPLVQIAIIVPTVIALIIITMKTTRGGWRWRWGERD